MKQVKISEGLTEAKIEKIKVVKICDNKYTTHIIQLAPCSECKGQHIVASTKQEYDVCSNQECGITIGRKCKIGIEDIETHFIVCKFCRHLYCKECVTLDKMQIICDYCYEYLPDHFSEWKANNNDKAKATFQEFETFLIHSNDE